MPEAPLPHTSLDKGLKAYFRVLKTVPLRLLGLNPDPAHVRSDETTAIVRQLEADRYFLYEPPGQAPEALLLEIFLDPPKEEQFLDCLLKALQLARDRKLPVVLVFLYLRQGRYATFPDELVMEGFAGLRNLYQV
ncbi:MAG: hypothetical protein FJX77_08855, partial [Armatimonadetes bacterium]|nr:hypothetical protein [Armatimonadota bacterium]